MGEIVIEDDHMMNSSSSNWTISHGSLHSSIIFESSDSPIDSDSTHFSPPLILHRPSPDYPPCEINLSFMLKHEIRQVYVRSTARVYEMYYAPTQQSENEYLCTVRCSIAERDGEFLQASGVEVNDNIGKPTEGSVTAEARHCTSEDDWIEVKAPDSSFIGNKVSCMQEHTTRNEGKSIEDLYEATAQISDAEPCMSLTIRFLSLESRDSVYIDELYIFADPIDSNELETPAVPVGNQASSFMAMLVPTLLQLSKSGISKKHDKDVNDIQRKESEVGIAARTSDFADAKEEYDQEKGTGADNPVQLGVDDQSTAEPAHSQPLTHDNLCRENCKISTMNNEASEARIERALEQLLDRVSRIENICMKFEENMVSPMKSMEMRLQRLEHQVEVLVKNSQSSGPHGTRITASSFTCSESNSTSLYKNGSEYQPCGASELEKKDLPCNKLCGPCDNTPVSLNPSHVVPNFVISAPEFSCGEDEEESDIVESTKVSSQETQKQVLSIDDALAAALSGFLSTCHVPPPDDGSLASGSVVNEKNEFLQSSAIIVHDCSLEGNGVDRPSKYTKMLAVTAPDFFEDEPENPNNAFSATAPKLACEENGNNEIASLSIESGGLVDLDRSKSMHTSNSTVASEPYAEQQGKFLHENVQTSGIAGSHDHPHAQERVGRSEDPCPSDEDDKVGETNARDSNSHYLENAADASDVDVTQNVCEYVRTCALDFDIPILDVKFAANEDSDTKLSLQVLLAEDSLEASSFDENTDNAGVGTAFAVRDDKEPAKCCAGDSSNPLVDFAFTSLDEDSSNPSISSSQEVFIGLV